jgi:hypothetical protein
MKEIIMERIIPDCMKAPVAAPAVEEAKTAELQTARVENVIEGMCPLCKRPMKLSTANNIPVHVCLDHSLVVPLRNQEPLNV